MQITSRCRPSVALNGFIIVRVQVIYPRMFTNGSLGNGKAILISQPSENIPSHHFRTVIILIVEVVVIDEDIIAFWIPIFGT